uniref:Uncharacterized protein n=1 Tax=Chlamydomonas leiostraca TaxID=1034604 RepID=A0A7S0RCG9_9CHLO
MQCLRSRKPFLVATTPSTATINQRCQVPRCIRSEHGVRRLAPLHAVHDSLLGKFLQDAESIEGGESLQRRLQQAQEAASQIVSSTSSGLSAPSLPSLPNLPDLQKLPDLQQGLSSALGQAQSTLGQSLETVKGTVQNTASSLSLPSLPDLPTPSLPSLPSIPTPSLPPLPSLPSLPTPSRPADVTPLSQQYIQRFKEASGADFQSVTLPDFNDFSLPALPGLPQSLPDVSAVAGAVAESVSTSAGALVQQLEEALQLPPMPDMDGMGNESSGLFQNMFSAPPGVWLTGLDWSGVGRALGGLWASLLSPFAVFGDKWLLNVFFLASLSLFTFALLFKAPKQ